MHVAVKVWPRQGTVVLKMRPPYSKELEISRRVGHHNGWVRVEDDLIDFMIKGEQPRLARLELPKTHGLVDSRYNHAQLADGAACDVSIVRIHRVHHWMMAPCPPDLRHARQSHRPMRWTRPALHYCKSARRSETRAGQNFHQGAALVVVHLNVSQMITDNKLSCLSSRHIAVMSLYFE